MASLSKTVRLSAGLAGLGYGVYRLARGRRDWLTTTFVTTGLSVALNAMTGRRVNTRDIASVATALTRSAPDMSRAAVKTLRHAPEQLVNAGWLP